MSRVYRALEEVERRRREEEVERKRLREEAERKRLEEEVERKRLEEEAELKRVKEEGQRKLEEVRKRRNEEAEQKRLKEEVERNLDQVQKHRKEEIPNAAVDRPSASISTSSESGRHLRVFLCHASENKQVVRILYTRLQASLVDPWLDEEDLLAGQDWEREIRKAVMNSDVVIVCLSREAINKKGYVQKEIRYALDVADEQPEDTIFLIPLKLEKCNIPERLSRWQGVNLFEDKGYDRLIRALKHRANSLSLEIPK